MLRYAWREAVRNPRRTLAALVGIVLGVGLFSGVLFFIDGSGASITRRALAPVAIDLQRVSTSPLGESLRLLQQRSPAGAVRRGQTVRVTLTVVNRGATSANEVVVNDKLPAAVAYVAGSARRDARPLTDPGGQSPFAHGPGRIGLNAGTVPAGRTVRYRYRVRARRAVGAGDLRLRATLSSRERIAPQPANAPPEIEPTALARQAATIPGVAGAHLLSFADLAPRSLRSGSGAVEGPVKVFGFDAGYARQYPAITVARGRFSADGVLLSPVAARALKAGPASHVQLQLPDGAAPVDLTVSGIADLSRARALFNSREGSKLEDFLYVPNSVVLSPAAFRRLVLPAFRVAQATRGSAIALKAPPTVEVDAALARGPLDADRVAPWPRRGGSPRRCKPSARGRTSCWTTRLTP